jgi:hypothetical protein
VTLADALGGPDRGAPDGFPNAGAGVSSQPKGAALLLVDVDHLVYGAPDLQAGIDRIEELLGIRATPGGQHPGAGTRNALAALGPGTYLEIVGPDLDQDEPAGPRWFGVDRLTTPALVMWAAKAHDLDELARDAVRHGLGLGEVRSGCRRAPDGSLLSWRFTNPETVIAGGIVPFFIDWGQTPHPARTAARGGALVDLRAEHPQPRAVRESLDRLGLALAVTEGWRPALVATIDSPRGRVELR